MHDLFALPLPDATIFDDVGQALAEASPIIHVANVLYLAAYLVRDILWLRSLIVVGGSMLLYYYFDCQVCGDNRMGEIVWGSVFASVNLFQIFLLVRERWPRSLAGAERALYDQIFHNLTPGEFVKLLKVGTWRENQPGDTLVQNGTVVEHMMVLSEGAAEVRAGDRVLARLEAGQFVGEMSFLTKEKAAASVVAATPTKVLSWPQKDLQRFLAKHGELSFKVRGVLGRDLVGKLRGNGGE